MCLHYPHLFVLEFDHHRVTCRVLALHHVGVDLGRDYHRILLTPERVLTEHKVGHGWGEALSWEDCQLKWNKYGYNVCKNNVFTKFQIISQRNKFILWNNSILKINKTRKYPCWQWLLRRTLTIIGVPMDTAGSVSSMSSFVVSPYRSRKDPPNLEIWMCNFPAICNHELWKAMISPHFNNIVHKWDRGIIFNLTCISYYHLHKGYGENFKIWHQLPPLAGL